MSMWRTTSLKYGCCCLEAINSEKELFHTTWQHRLKQIQSAQFQGGHPRLESPIKYLCEIWSQSLLLFLSYIVEKWPEKVFCRTLWFHSEVGLRYFKPKKKKLLLHHLNLLDIYMNFCYYWHTNSLVTAENVFVRPKWPWSLTKVKSVHQSKWTFLSNLNKFP